LHAKVHLRVGPARGVWTSLRDHDGGSLGGWMEDVVDDDNRPNVRQCSSRAGKAQSRVVADNQEARQPIEWVLRAVRRDADIEEAVHVDFLRKDGEILGCIVPE